VSLTWTSDIEIGIREIDEQHWELFSRFESFSDKIETAYTHALLPDFISFLDEHCRSCFKAEERLQGRACYPDKELHAAAHRQMERALASIRQQLNAGIEPLDLARVLKKLITEWIQDHTNGMDLVFSRFLQEASQRHSHELAGNLLGEVLIDQGIITRKTLEKALIRQQESGSKLGAILEQMGVVTNDEICQAVMVKDGSTHYSKKLGAIVVELGLISAVTLERALEIQKRNRKQLGAILVDMGVLDFEDMVEALAIKKGMVRLASN
jgi:hemerythrin